MSATRYKPVGKRATVRMTEAAELEVWKRTASEDNRDQMARLRKNLRLVWDMELTHRQAQVMEMFYDQELTVTQIARELGLSPSTVSRTLKRGRERLKDYLQYTL